MYCIWILFSIQDPLKLERCVISIDPEYDEVFEIMDSNKESFLFKVSGIFTIKGLKKDT